MVKRQIIIFVLASAGPIYVSQAAPRQPHAHGFWRFGAWEAIVALVALNAPAWFRKPLAWCHLLSWTLLILSLVPLALGVRQKHARRTEQERPEPSLLGFEKRPNW